MNIRFFNSMVYRDARVTSAIGTQTFTIGEMNVKTDTLFRVFVKGIHHGIFPLFNR
jgi:hypothetical protein